MLRSNADTAHDVDVVWVPEETPGSWEESNPGLLLLAMSAGFGILALSTLGAVAFGVAF